MDIITLEGINFKGLPLAPYCNIEHSLYAYYVGENGKIWSAKDKKYLEPIMTPSGYYRVRLKFKSYKVHYLVAYTYFEKFRLNDSMDVHHIDGNKLNNTLSNIMPVTREEHEHLHGRKIFTK